MIIIFIVIHMFVRSILMLLIICFEKVYNGLKTFDGNAIFHAMIKILFNSILGL
jgi:hypothetical protein